MAEVKFPTNSSFLKPMGPINTLSWNQSKGQIEGALSPRKVCCPRNKDRIGEGDSGSTIGPSVLAQLSARFDALDAKISAQSTLFFKQFSQLQPHMEKGFSLIDGQML